MSNGAPVAVVTKMIPKLFLLTVVFLAGGCAVVPKLVPIDFDIRDDPANERMQLEYKNRSKSTMCLSTSYWPYEGNGLLDAPGERVVLLVGESKFFMQDALIGYSIGGDDKRVPLGESTRSFVRYQSFRLPDDLRYAKKNLVLPAMGYRCR